MTEPSKPSSPLATGGMSKEGTATVVKVGRPKPNPVDKKVLCSAICKCKDQPGTGTDGRSLKQACASGRLRALDDLLKHRSIYKPEVNYDMTKAPPAPVMDSQTETKSHECLPGWIKKWWDTPDERGAQRPPFKPGKGMVHRPDVVVVNDPVKPPTQDNIKQVVEIKFPPDKLSQDQQDDYATIAGGENKLVVMVLKTATATSPSPTRRKSRSMNWARLRLQLACSSCC
jgi:hypothetical protein